MAKINIKQFCKEFKAYEEKVGKTTAWRGVLSEVGNAAKNESTRSFEAQGSPLLTPTDKRFKTTLQKVRLSELRVTSLLLACWLRGKGWVFHHL